MRACASNTKKARNGTMSYSVGDKFVIEIKEVFMSQDNADKLYRVNDFKSLVFDESGLDKLER